MSYAMTWMLSVDAVHERLTLVPVGVPFRLVGALGGTLSSSHAGGVMLTVSLPCDTLPAASRDWTYRTQGTVGTTANVVDRVLPSTDLFCWPSWKTSYATTPTLSVEASQLNTTLLHVRPVALALAGVVGSSVSSGPALP